MRKFLICKTCQIVSATLQLVGCDDFQKIKKQLVLIGHSQNITFLFFGSLLYLEETKALETVTGTVIGCGAGDELNRQIHESNKEQ